MESTIEDFPFRFDETTTGQFLSNMTPTLLNSEDKGIGILKCVCRKCTVSTGTLPSERIAVSAA